MLRCPELLSFLTYDEVDLKGSTANRVVARPEDALQGTEVRQFHPFMADTLPL